MTSGMRARAGRFEAFAGVGSGHVNLANACAQDYQIGAAGPLYTAGTGTKKCCGCTGLGRRDGHARTPAIIKNNPGREMGLRLGGMAILALSLAAGQAYAESFET